VSILPVCPLARFQLKRRRGGLFTSCCLLVVLASSSAAVQREESSSRAGAVPESGPAGLFSETVEVGSILVPVVVRSTDGSYLTELRRKDFRLLVNDRPVPIESFERRAEAPISVVFLQDLSGSMATAGRLEASRGAIERLLEQARAGDEFAIATFAGGGLNVEVPFTTSVETVLEAMGLWEAYGTTALHDAVAWLPAIGAEGRHPKRAAILLTDGGDNASTLPPGEARAIVRQAQLPIYVLGLDSGDPYELRSHPQPGGRAKMHRYGDVLNLLAHYTGGSYIAVDSKTDMKAALARITEELRHQYVLSFRMQREGLRDDFRLRIEVVGRKVHVSTRQGYRGTPPAAWNLP